MGSRHYLSIVNAERGKIATSEVIRPKQLREIKKRKTTTTTTTTTHGSYMQEIEKSNIDELSV